MATTRINSAGAIEVDGAQGPKTTPAVTETRTGNPGDVLTLDANGVLSWAAPSADVDASLVALNAAHFHGDNAALADGALANGDLTFWLDQTNGACVLNIKAKQADGTVRTAQVALA